MPDKSEIKGDVDRILSDTAKNFGIPHKPPLDDKLKLSLSLHGADSLGFTEKIKSLLAIPFSKISRGKHGGKWVTQKESKKCETVDDCVTLVHKKATTK